MKRTLKRVHWIKSRNKLLKRNVNSKKQELRQLFCLWYIISLDMYNLWRYRKIICHKHNLKISSSVGSGHPVKYFWDSPWILNTYHGKGTSREMAISLLAYVATFLRQFYFWRNCFFTLVQSNYFDTAVTF